MQDIVDAFTKETGITVKVNTVDHGTFQNQLNSYLQATPDDVFTWFSGYRMRFFAAKGLATDVSDVWGKIGSNYSDAFKVGATGDDGKQYFVPIYNYPWAVFYRKSLFKDKGYNIPKTWADYKTLLAKMKSDGLVPLAFGDKDGWPAMGTFDIINLRKNGYQFHVDHGRQAEVDGPEGQGRLQSLEGDPALRPGGRSGPDLAGRCSGARQEAGRFVRPGDVRI